jgi:uncharacterized membrane protein YhhN
MDGDWLERVVAGAAAIAVAGLLLFGEWRGQRGARWLFKPLASLLFVVAAFLEEPRTPYDWLIVAGLALGAIGDVALIPSSRRWFLAGLVAFLLGHLAYVAAIAARPEPWQLEPRVVAPACLASLAAYLYLRPHLGRMRLPVVAYVLVITAMLAAAGSLAASPGVAGAGSIALAAALFYLSDLTVARSRFVPGAGLPDRLVGLPLYYGAQFLFALSVGG